VKSPAGFLVSEQRQGDALQSIISGEQSPDVDTQHHLILKPLSLASYRGLPLIFGSKLTTCLVSLE